MEKDYLYSKKLKLIFMWQEWSLQCYSDLELYQDFEHCLTFLLSVSEHNET